MCHDQTWLIEMVIYIYIYTIYGTYIRIIYIANITLT